MMAMSSASTRLSSGNTDPQGHGDDTAFTEEQIRQFASRGARPRSSRPRRPSGLAGGEQPPAEPHVSTSAHEIFGPTFLQGFFVNCSACRLKNKASAKCYECNTYLCEKCVSAHARGRSTNYHHIYHFDSLAERLSPTVTGLLSPSATQSNSSDQDLPLEQPGSESSTENPTSSRVVGAGRRSTRESSQNSSRSSSFTLQSPSESCDPVASVQAAIQAISLSVGGSSSSLFSPTLSPSNGILPVNQSDVSRNGILPKQDEAALVQGDSLNMISRAEFDLSPCTHHQSDFKFFCTDCMVPICCACLQEKHLDHSLIYISEALHKLRQMTQDLNSQIRDVNVGLRQALDGLQRMCECIDYRAHQVAIDVKCTVRRFITALEARQDDILQRIEQARQIKLRLINGQMENIRVHYSRLARAIDLINDPAIFTTPIDNMVANHRAFRELRQAKNLGPNIYPCEDDGFMFMPPSDSQLQSIAFLGHLHVSSGPMSNSVALCRQPLLYVNTRVNIPDYPVPAAKARPIFGCMEIVAIKDFGRMPKLMWGKAGTEDGELCRPWGITINRFGHFIVADRSNNRIQVFDTEGKYLFHFGSHGSRNGQFDRPSSVAVNPNDDLVVADKDNHRIQVFNRSGEFLFTFGERGSQIGQFMYPWDVACDSVGNILVSDARNHRIQLFRWNGIFIAKWGGDLCLPRLFDTPRGVAFDPMGNILMTDFNLHRVVMIERLTGKIRYIGREGRERGQFNRPQGICCDDRGWFVVADSRNYRFQVFNEKGEFMWMVGRQGKEDPGEFDRPCDVCVDPEGHIHVLDFGNDRLQVF